MITLEETTLIHAPLKRCFDLSRSIDLHTKSTQRTGERAIAGVTSGLIGLGEEVTWSARHLGVKQTMTVRIHCGGSAEVFPGPDGTGSISIL